MTKNIIHPGEHLSDELNAHGIGTKELAKSLNISPDHLEEIIAGKRGISEHMAILLGNWFGTGPEIWMNLQMNYELRHRLQGLK